MHWTVFELVVPMKKMNQTRFALLAHQKTMMPSLVDCLLLALVAVVVVVAARVSAVGVLVDMVLGLIFVVLGGLIYRRFLQSNSRDS